MISYMSIIQTTSVTLTVSKIDSTGYINFRKHDPLTQKKQVKVSHLQQGSGPEGNTFTDINFTPASLPAMDGWREAYAGVLVMDGRAGMPAYAPTTA